MVRKTQLMREPRLKQLDKKINKLLLNNPQKKVTCLKITTMSPKKPNSANRRIAKVGLLRLEKQIQRNIKIPGEGHTLQQYSTMLVKGGRVRDLVGVSNIAIRGNLDLLGVENRKSSRSIYGVKKQTN